MRILWLINNLVPRAISVFKLAAPGPPSWNLGTRLVSHRVTYDTDKNILLHQQMSIPKRLSRITGYTNQQFCNKLWSFMVLNEVVINVYNERY